MIAGTLIANIQYKRILKLMWIFRYFLVLTFLIHFLFTPALNEYNWGIFHISLAGVHNGILYSIRVFLLMWSASLFGWVTSPVALGDSLEELLKFLSIFRIPPRDVSMVVVLAMRFIPTMLDDATKIHWAQQARGASMKGSIIKRVKKVIPLIIPLFVVAFRRADKLALALQMRGYDPHFPRTRISPQKFTLSDYIVSLCTVICLTIYLMLIII